MNRKRSLIALIVLLGMIAGLFGPPVLGQGVRAAPQPGLASESVEIIWFETPPATLCKDEPVQIMFLYSVHRQMQSGSGFTPVPPNAGTIFATSTLRADLDPVGSWPYDEYKPFGFVTAQYTPHQKGQGRIGIESSNRYVPVTGGDSGAFKVVDCTWRITFGASDLRYNIGLFDFVEYEFTGRGGMALNRTDGTLSGSGMWRFSVTQVYKNFSADLTCQSYKVSSSTSNFSIVHGNAVSNALNFGIDLSPVSLGPIDFRCVDKAGVITYVEGFIGGNLGNDPAVGFDSLNFAAGQTTRTFPFGQGQGAIFLVPRKGH